MDKNSATFWGAFCRARLLQRVTDRSIASTHETHDTTDLPLDALFTCHNSPPSAASYSLLTPQVTPCMSHIIDVNKKFEVMPMSSGSVV